MDFEFHQPQDSALALPLNKLSEKLLNLLELCCPIQWTVATGYMRLFTFKMK